MSLFKKPKKKIQRRVFCADDDDDEDGEPEAPPPPVISQEKKENKPIKAKNTPMLSFADDVEDGEVFKVKKSTQSKRLAKRREKERRRVPDGDNNTFDNNTSEDDSNHTNNEQDTVKPKKKVTLEGLILSGREALAADGTGDVSSGSGGEEEDNRGFHQYRAESVRAALAVTGHIPDAALIHAARKTRQQARELGDFVPVKEPPAGGRLARDDGSGDDDDEGRIQVRGLDLPSDKPKRGTAAAPSDEELDSGAEEWAEQQMQKAMPAIVDLTGEGVEVNPFSLPPVPPRLAPAPAHLRPLAAPGQPPPATAQLLLAALKTRFEELQADRESTAARKTQVLDRLLRAARTRESRAARCEQLGRAYRRAQAVRGYLTDLVECLDEKMPQLETLEARALALHRRRTELLVERRRADVRDQARDVLALAARAGSVRAEGAEGAAEAEGRTRRAAEREGRRRARRLQREAAAAAAAHRDGDSSDDDLPPAEAHHQRGERDAIRQMAQALFVDALSAWRDVRGVCRRLARWRREHRALYSDAYLPDCLPRLLAPYVRHQLILWNPLADEDNEDFEKMDWYKCLMMYGVRSEKISSESESEDDEEEYDEPGSVTEHSVREDVDLMLVPTIVCKVVLPKLTELVEASWDPMCVRACVRLRQCVLRAACVPGAVAGLRRLGAVAAARLHAARAADVFLPTLPPHIMEGPGAPFWRRCLGAGVRLLRATLALAGPPPLLHADSAVLQLIETLCCAAGAATGPCACAAARAIADTLPRAGALRAAALRRLARLARLALDRLDAHSPLHLSSVEQARAIIAEARSLE